MSASTKLSSAVKALCYLAESFPEAKSSAEISRKIGVNASKLRHLLSMLAKKNIVVSKKGIEGGFVLQKRPAQLHLQEIYCAVEDRKAFHLDVHRKIRTTRDESALFNDYFLDLFADIQVEIEDKMKKIKLKSIIEKIKSKS